MKRIKEPGFTIVELLIVIVVIAILAAITVVAFNGIQQRANDSVVQSDLSNLYKSYKLATETGDIRVGPLLYDNIDGYSGEAFSTSDTDAFNTQLKHISVGGYDTTEQYPLVAIKTRRFNFTGEQWEAVHQYEFAARSKSGKVYYINDQTGGVTQEFTDWQELINSDNAYLTNLQDWITQYPANETYYREEIDRVNANIARMQTLSTQDAAEWRVVIYTSSLYGRGLSLESVLPARINTIPQWEHAGFLYDAPAGRWEPISGSSNDI